MGTYFGTGKIFMLEVIITLSIGLTAGYFLARYKFSSAHYEEINNIRAHYEVKLLKKTMEDRVRDHG
jgi:hypothetical protein|tara:strand:+ start:288 stop:488 length:201 start_codon:yes stop_codon:yes gene_type:complete